MPKITIDMLPGRTLEQKRKLVERMTEVISETINVRKESIYIVIHENPKENVALGGQLIYDRK